MTYYDSFTRRLTFGKHDGEHITEVPASYIRWCLREISELASVERAAFQAEIDRRESKAGGRQSGRSSSSSSWVPPPSTNLPTKIEPAVVLEIIQAGRKALARQYHPDVAGVEMTEKMKVVNVTADALEKSARALMTQAGGAA